MKYAAIVDFIDLEDDMHLYHAGESYPRHGLTPTKERIDFLASDKNKMGYPLIEAVKSKKAKK